MKALVNLGDGPSRWLRKSRTLGIAIQPILHALVTVDQLFLKLHHVPPLYATGVRYQEEPLGQVEEFAAVPVVLERLWGDCDDLAPWRCAELRNLGEKAKIRLQWKMLNITRGEWLRGKNGQKLYHVVVRRARGAVKADEFNPSYMALTQIDAMRVKMGRWDLVSVIEDPSKRLGMGS
jgi:hypothetical protein